ncbi:N-6 DNA methylase [Nocardia sp. NPDC004568]|uniref:N-6 DNA methylase n=1 Tax=Nocardia sp. NPDC004568 TaxID=3154551 RepID=UPI0033B4BF12
MQTTDIAQRLFKVAAVLRDTMGAAEYASVMSVVLALKWASDHQDRLIVPPEAQWDQVVAAADSSPRTALNKAATALVSSNPAVFDDAFLQVIKDKQLSNGAAQELIATLDEISFGDESPEPEDLAGKIYEQLLAAFVDSDKRAEFSTPRSVGQLMVRLTDPQPGDSVYDPCVGTGGLLIAAEEYVESETGRDHAITVFGQDVVQQTCAIARLNLMLHGSVKVSIQRGDALINPSYHGSTGDLKQFDRVLTDPPFSLKYQQDMLRIPQHTRYGQSRVADLMFVQHVLASLTADGVGVIAVPNGVLFRAGDEGRIRREMVRDGRIAAVIALGRNLFHGTSIPACLLVVRGMAAAHAKAPDVLFINAEQEVDVTRSKTHLAPRHVEKIVTTYHEEREIRHFSRLVSVEEIASKEFDLNVSKYIDPQPPRHPKLDIEALLKGGVPVDDVNLQSDRFATFGIDLASLFAPSKPGYLEFPPDGYTTTAAKIPVLSAPTESAFAAAVGDWFQQFKEEIALTNRLPAAARRHFAERFRRTLSAWSVLNSEQLAGLFVDWWTANQNDLEQLSRPADSSSTCTSTSNASTIEKVGADLIDRAKRLISQNRNQLVELYLTWGDQYATSLALLEHRRELAATRLATRLQKLGYQWPLTGPIRRPKM